MPQLVVKLGDSVIQNYSFDKDIVNIGRSRDSDITIDNLAVSRSHCRVRKMDSNFILTDLNSANGTYVNGVKITKTEILDNDIVSVGKHKLVFLLEDVKEEEAIGDAFGADRTMIVESTTEGILKVTKGKNKGEEFKVTKYETKIGRAPENDVVINDWFVSKTHAKIIKQGDNYVLKDLGSWKGTFIAEKLIKEPAPLRDGDDIRFGSTRFRFSIFDEKEQLKLEGRRPEELGYDAPPPDIPDSPPAMPPSQQDPLPDISIDLPDSEVKRTVQLGAMDVDDNFDSPEIPDSPPSPVERALSDDEIDFDSLPDPDAVFESMGASIANATGGVTWEEFEIYAATAGTGWGSASSTSEAAEAPPGDDSAPPLEPPIAVADLDDAKESTPRLSPTDTPPMQPAAEVAGEDDDEIARQVALWKKALVNKSPIIRRQAAKMLKKLTGKDYEAEG